MEFTGVLLENILAVMTKTSRLNPDSVEHNNLANNTERIYFNFNDLMLGLTIFGKMGNYWLTKILIDHW